MTLDPSTSRELSHRLATEQATSRLPSIVAGIVRGSRLVWSDAAAGSIDGRRAAHPTTDTQYRIGSITKTFVAVEVMRLRDEGRLGLGDTIGAHLPEVPFGQVTIAQLLTHTSGLQAETDGQWWERSPGESWHQLMAAAPILRFVLGVQFHYSNVGYAVLGELVSRLRGMPWGETLRVGILEPLGMARTTTRPIEPAAPGFAVHPFADLVHDEPEHDAGAMAPAGQLWSTVQDLAVWAAFLGGDTHDVLAAETLTEMLRPIAVNDVTEAPWTAAHGLGWQTWNLQGRRFAGHGGSMPGFLAVLRVDTVGGDGVVLMTNATSGLGPVAPDLLRILTECEPVTPRPWTADASQVADLDLTGDWFWGTIRFTLATGRRGELLLGTPGEGRGAKFRRDAEGWIGLDGYYTGEPLIVERDAGGEPVRLVLASFVFMRTPYGSAADASVGPGAEGWH